jgi:hypothetical protein
LYYLFVGVHKKRRPSAAAARHHPPLKNLVAANG